MENLFADNDLGALTAINECAQIILNIINSTIAVRIL